jgi:hypothetical protein
MGLSQSAQIRLNMARIASDTGVSVPKQEESDSIDEEAAPNQTKEETISDEEQHRCGWWVALSNNRADRTLWLWWLFPVILIIIVVGLGRFD